MKSCTLAECLKLEVTAATGQASSTQTFQNALIKEYTISHIRDPTII